MALPHESIVFATPPPISDRRAARLRRVASRAWRSPYAFRGAARAARLLDHAERLARHFALDRVGPLLDRAAVLGHDDDRCRARVLSVRANLDRNRARFDTALVAAQEALHLWVALDDLIGEALARAEITRVLLDAGSTADALDEGVEALATAEKSGDLHARALAMRALSHVYLSLEQFDQAIALCESASELTRRVDDEVLEGGIADTIACAYGMMSYQATADGDPARARELLERSMAMGREAVRLARRSGHRYNEATAMANLAEGLVLCDRADEALVLMESWTDGELSEVPNVVSQHFDIHGRICMALGRHDEAVALFGRSLAAARTSGLAMLACEHLADACEKTGDLAAALAHHRRFHALFRQVTSEAAQRSASVAAVRLETQRAHDNVIHHRAMAEDLQRSNEQLTRRADDLLHLSLHDPLTGLGNRRSMERLLDDDRKERAIVMIDLDRFKTINDGWSHTIGDAVLRQVATLIRQCCREADTAVRYGGDEFAIVLAQSEHAAARATAERVRHLVEVFDWRAIADGLAVSVSVGFATADDREDASGILEIADRRMYDAKQAGRNCVVGSRTT